MFLAHLLKQPWTSGPFVNINPAWQHFEKNDLLRLEALYKGVQGLGALYLNTQHIINNCARVGRILNRLNMSQKPIPEFFKRPAPLSGIN